MKKAKLEKGQSIEAGWPTVAELGYSDYEIAHISLLIKMGDREPIEWKDDDYYFHEAVKLLLKAREFRMKS